MRARILPACAARRAKSAAVIASTAPRPSSPMASMPTWCSSPPRPVKAGVAATSPCLRWRRARPASALGAASKSTAGCRATPPNWCSKSFLPDANVLGEEGRGFSQLVNNLQNERIVLAAQALGEAMKAIEITLDWVKQRRAFGAPLWDKQAIRQRLSMQLAEVEAARALLFNTAWRDQRNENVVKEVSMLKALAGTLVNGVMYDCLQFHGGMGYMLGTTIERMTRDARVQAIGGGATEVMLDEVAKRL